MCQLYWSRVMVKWCRLVKKRLRWGFTVWCVGFRVWGLGFGLLLGWLWVKGLTYLRCYIANGFCFGVVEFVT